MIVEDIIQTLVKDHKVPYVYNTDNFIPGETPIYYSGPYWDDKEMVAAISVLLNGKWVTVDKNVSAFEKKFSEMFHTKHSLMTNSGSSANLILIAGLKQYYEWQDEDEIIVSPAAFPTTISVLHQNRLKPVFVDIEWETLNFDLSKIEEKITERTKGIFLAPVLGNPPNMNKLIDICEKYSLKLILDNCDSLGSKWGEKYLNEYSIAYSNSFYPAHHISTGEGGMVCSDNQPLMKLMRSLVNWGRDCYCIGTDSLLPEGKCKHRFAKWLDKYDGVVDHKYVFSSMGYNVKPLDLQGAIGSVQLEKFNKIDFNRRIAKTTIEAIVTRNISGIRGVKELQEASTCWFGTPFICNTTELKRKLVRHLENNKIQTRNYFAGNILMHPGYSFLDDYKKYPEANKVLDKVFFVGASPHYGEEVFNYIETVVKQFK